MERAQSLSYVDGLICAIPAVYVASSAMVVVARRVESFIHRNSITCLRAGVAMEGGGMDDVL
jgi:hypothetical protein